jgi:uncharacterized protein
MPVSAPQRSCIACKALRNKNELLRFVLTPEQVLVPDLLAKLPGRGAYTCIDSSCIRMAVQKGQFNRAFKAAVKPIDVDGLLTQLWARIKERIGSYISLANKAGQVVSGSDMAVEAMRKKKQGLTFIASDVSLEIGEKLAETAEKCGVPHYKVFDKEHMGALIGKGLRSVVVIESGGLAEKLKDELARYRKFLEGGMDAR